MEKIIVDNENKTVCSLFGKIRFILGICFNIWLLYTYGMELINGGMVDSGWDYHYDIIPQYMLVLSCCISLYADIKLFKKKDKSMNLVLVASNLLFWLSFFMLYSCDTKTHISYFVPLGIIAFLIVGFVMSWIHLQFFDNMYCCKDS